MASKVNLQDDTLAKVWSANIIYANVIRITVVDGRTMGQHERSRDISGRLNFKV